MRAAGRGCSSLRPTTGAPGGQGRNASGSFRRAAPALSRGLGASSLLTGILQAWRGCLTAGILQAWRGACCLKTGKEQAPGPFPGARPDRSIVFPPVLSRRPVLAQMRRSGGAIVMAIGASSPACIPVEGLDRGRPGRAERGRGMAARRGSPQSGRTVGGGSVSGAGLDPAA